MLIQRRQFLRMATGAAALVGAARTVAAQTYPAQPARIIVGFAAGGATDIVARLMAQWLSDRLGQPFIVENRTGAASNIATETVVRAPAGRLHAAACRIDERDQYDPLRQAQFQFRPRHRAGRGASCSRR